MVRFEGVCFIGSFEILLVVRLGPEDCDLEVFHCSLDVWDVVWSSIAVENSRTVMEIIVRFD